MPPKRSAGSAPSAADEAPARHYAPGAIIPELDILKPLPNVVNDDSPQFTLINVEVLAKDSNKHVNLLHAELEGPFRVRGTLVLDRKQKAEYMLPHAKLPKSHVFELDDCSTYAVQSDSVIWAAGKAGWYDIQPSAAYEGIFNHMVEAADIFYALEDFHTDEADTDRRCPLVVDLLALEYIQSKNLKLRVEAVKNIWLEHAKFLIGHMQKPSEVDWPLTPVYKWLAKSAPNIYRLFHPTSYVKTYPSKSAKPRVIAGMVNETMDVNPYKHWTIDALAKAIPLEKLGLKNADQAKEHIEANAAAIMEQLQDRYLGSPVTYHLLEIAFARELELGGEFVVGEDIGPEVHKRAKIEHLRRKRATAKTVVDLMHNLAASGEIAVKALTVENVAAEVYKRYTVKTEQAAIELIKSASSEITAAIAHWGLKYIHTPICKELCWVSQYRIDKEQLEEKAGNFALHYRDHAKDAEFGKKLKHFPSRNADEARAKILSLFVTEMMNNDELSFATMTISDVADCMSRHFVVDNKQFAEMVIIANADPFYQILDLKYAATPLRMELIRALTKEVLMMDKSAPETELKPRSSTRKNSKRESVASEHITRAARKHSAPSSAQPTPKKRGSFMDAETRDIHTPIQRHPAGKGAGKASTRRPVGTPLVPLRRPSNIDEEEDIPFDSPKRRKISDLATSHATPRPSVSFLSKTEETTPEAEIAAGPLYETEEEESEDGDGEAYETALQPIDLGQGESPNGPDGVWMCEKEGCGAVVANASLEEGRERVRKHFLWHADEVEARWNLVKAAERPYLPVENLLRHFERVGQKVRMGEERRAERDANGEVVPEPLKRAGL